MTADGSSEVLVEQRRRTESEDPSRPGVAPLRLAYLVNEYPKGSHTFIRREILELERMGHQILRLSVRPPGAALGDPADRDEAARTFVCLTQPKWKLLAATLRTMLLRPICSVRAAATALKLLRSSGDAGAIRHLAYFVEAAHLLRACERQGVSHLHAHFGTNPAAVALLMAKLSGKRLTYSFTIHGPDEFDAPRGFSLAAKVEGASFVVAISDYCLAQLQRWSGTEEWKKIQVVRCTVSDEFLDDAVSIPGDSKTLLHIGRLAPDKGQLLLVEAMARLRDEGVVGRVVLAGDGPMRPHLERAIAARHLGDCIQLAGWLDGDAVRAQLRAARALVQPSFAEGLPVVMMEALAMRRPVIATAVAGVPELVRAGENGWLVPAGNVPELAAAMRAALSAPIAELERMGAAGTARVRERHYVRTEVAKLEKLFREAV